jgi:preprotein translocase subunit SecG
MEFLFPVMLTVHILVGLSVIGLVLLQHGKGADMGAAFGGGASGSLFGASGSANFLSRTTAVLATAFFITSLGLSYVAGSRPKAPSSVMEAPVKPAPELPADDKPKIPADGAPAATPVPSPAEAVDKKASPTPVAGKQMPAEPAPDANKESTAASAKPKTTAPAGRADAAASKGNESSSKSAAPAGKKLPDPTSVPSSSESKAKEIPK